MAVQTVPYALQNASHSAALFRQSASSAFVNGGALGSNELLVTEQGSPNMSVILAPGRAKVVGNSVSPPAGMGWTTQAMYDVLNDANVTLTIAAADAINPRIDLVYIQVQDSFYSGANNQAIAGVVTGTPAPVPSPPATPLNAVAIARVAVAAGVTSIVNANISRVIEQASVIGGGFVADLDALAALTGMNQGDIIEVAELGALFAFNGSDWVQQSDASFSSAANRDTAYNKASGVYKVAGRAKLLRTDTGYTQYWNGSIWRYANAAQVPVIPTSAVNGTVGASGVVTFSAAASVSLNGCFTTEFDYYIVELDLVMAAPWNIGLRLRVGGVDDSNAVYDTVITDGGITSLAATSWAINGVNQRRHTAHILLYNPALGVPTNCFSDGGASENPMTSAAGYRVGYGLFRNSTAFDGFTIITTVATTITGTIRVYGINNN